MKDSPIYIFNPDHDLALASNEENYMPPASARQMATDLAVLPAWYAESGSRVLAASAYNAEFLRERLAPFSGERRIELITPPELSANAESDFIPWGWNRSLRKKLTTWGTPRSALPTDEKLDELRRLSHRSQAVDLLPRLQQDANFCGSSACLFTKEEQKRYVEAHERCVLKAPFSGSGKGLNWCKGVFTPAVANWCARVGTAQGGVIGEPAYRKTEDFAMEFFSDGAGNVRFAGYSLFRTGSSGMYEGSLLNTDERIESTLARYVPIDSIRNLRQRLLEEISARFGPVYTGYLGVDMMICRFDESPEYRIHPCVEVNLRMNMGVAARLLYDRYLSDTTEGVFQISCHTTEGEALNAHREMEFAHPLQTEGGRIRTGYLPLTPVTKHTLYRAWILCKPVENYCCPPKA